MKHGSVRRAILTQSYYIVYFLYFLVERNRTIVLAVLDRRRDPNEIGDVLKQRRPKR